MELSLTLSEHYEEGDKVILYGLPEPDKMLLAKAVEKPNSSHFRENGWSMTYSEVPRQQARTHGNCFKLVKNIHPPLCLLMKLTPLETKDKIETLEMREKFSE